MKLFLEGPCGRLEALYELPEGAPRAAAVVCHPHPRHGGTMHNTVVFRTARALRAAGLATLRFNFRGVEGSDGKHDGGPGEEQDAAAALDWLTAKLPDAELWAAGFSFGARTVAALARRDRRIRRLLCVALPTRSYALPEVAEVEQPALFLFASEDEHGNRDDFLRLVPHPPRHFETEEIAGTDHFFRHKTPLLEEAVRRYAANSLETRV